MHRQVTARANDEYGILAFASDHGVIQNGDAYFNGDSGIYPGSGSDLNADNTEAAGDPLRDRDPRQPQPPQHAGLLRYGGQLDLGPRQPVLPTTPPASRRTRCSPATRACPQDHARWSRNEIFRNNRNWYTQFVDTGVCAKPMEERGYIDRATVCPVVPTPVGTGVLIAGGNYNSTDHNYIFDNWRYGTMQFWVPAAAAGRVRPDQALRHVAPQPHDRQPRWASAATATIAHNGTDHWWDDEGDGNCWQDNTYSRGHRTDNFTVDPPSCDEGGSVFRPGVAVKDAGFLSCSQYDRNDPTFSAPAGRAAGSTSPTRPTAADPAPLAAARSSVAPGCRRSAWSSPAPCSAC